MKALTEKPNLSVPKSLDKALWQLESAYLVRGEDSTAQFSRHVPHVQLDCEYNRRLKAAIRELRALRAMLRPAVIYTPEEE